MVQADHLAGGREGRTLRTKKEGAHHVHERGAGSGEG